MTIFDANTLQDPLVDYSIEEMEGANKTNAQNVKNNGMENEGKYGQRKKRKTRSEIKHTLRLCSDRITRLRDKLALARIWTKRRRSSLAREFELHRTGKLANLTWYVTVVGQKMKYAWYGVYNLREGNKSV